MEPQQLQTHEQQAPLEQMPWVPQMEPSLQLLMPLKQPVMAAALALSLKPLALPSISMRVLAQGALQLKTLIAPPKLPPFEMPTLLMKLERLVLGVALSLRLRVGLIPMSPQRIPLSTVKLQESWSFAPSQKPDSLRTCEVKLQLQPWPHPCMALPLSLLP